jgi:hypothetical protein
VTDSGDSDLPGSDDSRLSDDVTLAAEIEELTYRISTQADRIGELEESLALTRIRLAGTEEKVRAMRSRRVWRFAEFLGQVRRQPTRILQAASVLVGTARDGEPSEPARPGRTIPEAGEFPPGGPVVLTLCSPWVEAILSAHARVVRLDSRHWRDQIDAQGGVAAVVVESSTAPGSEGLGDLIDELRLRRGIRSILWLSEGPLGISGGLFDLVLDEEPNGAGLFVGPIDMALHNPVTEGPRSPGVAVVDPDRLAVNETVLTPIEFARTVKRHSIIRWASPPPRRLAAAVAASGTPMVGEEDTEGRLLEALRRSEVLRARISHVAMREALCSTPPPSSLDRAIRGRNGYDAAEPIDVVVISNRPFQLETIFRNLGRQTYPDRRLYLVSHGARVEESVVSALADEFGVMVEEMLHVPSDRSLGEVIDLGLRRTTAGLVAKMDDDDFYGPEYLSDLKLALDYSGADVAGKWSHYAHLEASDLLVHRFKEFEHRFTELVAISTLLMHRHVLDMARFPPLPYGSGSVFLRELGEGGAKVYAADRWNYLYHRAADGSRHTYPLSDLQILNYAEVVCRGISTEAVVL